MTLMSCESEEERFRKGKAGLVNAGSVHCNKAKPRRSGPRASFQNATIGTTDLTRSNGELSFREKNVGSNL